MNTVIGNKSDLKQNQLVTQEDKPTVDSSLSIGSSQTIVNGESFPESFRTDVESQDMRCHQKSTTGAYCFYFLFFQLIRTIGRRDSTYSLQFRVCKAEKTKIFVLING